MTLEDQLATLKSHLAVAESEMASLKAGRKSAAPRLRKSLMALKTGSHGMRAGTTNYVRRAEARRMSPLSQLSPSLSPLSQPSLSRRSEPPERKSK